MPGNYTHIVLGSSPLSLAEAICLQLSGNKVLVIEQDTSFGGSWKTIQTKKFIDVETGCHVMYRNKAAYHFMEKMLGIKMLKFDPQPRIIRYNKNLNYKYTNCWDIIDVALGVHLKKREIRTVLAYFKRALFELMDTGKFYYPEGGSKSMIEKLMAKARAVGVTFNNIAVSAIELKNQQVEIYVGTHKITSNQIIITPNTTLQKIVSSEQTFEISRAEERAVANLFLLIEKSPKPMISYVGVKKHKIFRLADMTYNNPFYITKGQRLLCAQIRIEHLQNEGDAARMKDEVVDYLKKHQLVSPQMELIDWELYYYNYYHRHENFLNELPQSFKKNVSILRSHNFTISMAEIAERWNNSMPSLY